MKKNEYQIKYQIPGANVEYEIKYRLQEVKNFDEGNILVNKSKKDISENLKDLNKSIKEIEILRKKRDLLSNIKKYKYTEALNLICKLLNKMEGKNFGSYIYQQFKRELADYPSDYMPQIVAKFEYTYIYIDQCPNNDYNTLDRFPRNSELIGITDKIIKYDNYRYFTNTKVTWSPNKPNYKTQNTIDIAEFMIDSHVKIPRYLVFGNNKKDEKIHNSDLTSKSYGYVYISDQKYAYINYFFDYCSYWLLKNNIFDKNKEVYLMLEKLIDPFIFEYKSRFQDIPENKKSKIKK